MRSDQYLPDPVRERYSLKLFGVSLLIVTAIVAFSVVVGLQVSERVTDDPDGCTLLVADDGPGIPADELAALEAGTETPLQHSRGLLGLWQLRWRVDTLNGDLSFGTEDGTTVRITVPDQRRKE